eukprot:7233873-Alexandrium_andersonii.AAC.1
MSRAASLLQRIPTDPAWQWAATEQVQGKLKQALATLETKQGSMGGLSDILQADAKDWKSTIGAEKYEAALKSFTGLGVDVKALE